MGDGVTTLPSPLRDALLSLGWTETRIGGWRGWMPPQGTWQAGAVSEEALCRLIEAWVLEGWKGGTSP